MLILVTGGAGYIGSHTCVDLLDHGHDVVIADNYSTGSPEAVDAIRRLSGRRVTAHTVDLRDRNALDHVFAQHEFGAVIHFAAKKSVPESTQIPLEYYDTNLTGTVNLLRAMRDHKVGQLVFSSSCSVYGDAHDGPIGEDAATAPTNPYARSKLVAEQIMADACGADEDLSVIALRYFNPVGAHPSGALGEDPRGVPTNLMPHVTRVAMGWGDRLRVYGSDYPTPDGSAIRDYIHVMDVAEAHRMALEHVSQQTGFGVLNLGTGRGVSVLELVAAFEAECGVSVPYVLAGRRPGDVARLVADPGRAAREWGWRASRDLAAMCRDAWRFQQRRPAGYEPDRADSGPRG